MQLINKKIHNWMKYSHVNYAIINLFYRFAGFLDCVDPFIFFRFQTHPKNTMKTDKTPALLEIHKYLLQLPVTHTTFAQPKFSYFVTRIYNILPENIKNVIFFHTKL